MAHHTTTPPPPITSVRLSGAARTVIDAAAALTGTTRSEYLRTAALAAAERDLRSPRGDAK